MGAAVAGVLVVGAAVAGVLVVGESVAGIGEDDGGAAAYARAPKVRFVCLSDTHMQHRKMTVPSGDVLVHTGDFSNHGSLEEVREFAAWFAAQPHPLKLVVPGNHDMIMDAAYWADYWSDWSGTGDAT